MGLYIDFPFCIARCAFCAFPIQGFRSGLAEEYRLALHQEIELLASSPEMEGREIDSLYLGGGTPTQYPAEILIAFIEHCRAHFRFAPDPEISLEAHPATLNKSGLSDLLRGGINRLSLGVQSFSDTHLHRLGRNHSAADADAAFQAARSAGFENIGIDLIYGLPEQDLEDWIKTLQHAIALSPDHISIYGLSIEEGTLFGKMEKAGTLTQTRDEVLLDYYETARTILGNAGYLQYEISNFAKPGKACRHNQRYWNRSEMLGLGLAAHSYIRHERRENTENLSDYIEALKKGKSPSIRCDKISKEDEQIDKIIFGLRKTEGIPFQFLKHDAQRSRSASALANDGLVEIHNNRLRLTPKGMHLADEVAIALI